MIVFEKLVVLLLASLSAMVAGQTGQDYITEAPKTVYEDDTPSPQNMDFDKENNMFVAHSGWYNDMLIHYYKFRMYTPGTYPGVISPGVTSDAVPLQKIYFTTTSGNMEGVKGKPIIEYHTSDGLLYSDFMEVNLVTVPSDYTEDTFRSGGDIANSGAEVAVTGIILNIPVVPTGSTLQNPITKGTNKAPINASPVWYKGVEVWTYVFEVTDQVAADYFKSTRTDPDDTDYSITVTPFATASTVNSIPLWHVNQFTRGVTEEKANFGGPSSAGMRNIINLDRGDEGYSPLWQIFWMTALPLNYLADQASNFIDLTSDNGFEQFIAPMYVNCPDVGPVGDKNEDMATEFTTEIDMNEDSHHIIGSHQSLVMQGGVDVKFKTSDGTVIATTTTNPMGAYEFELMSADIPDGTKTVDVVAKDSVIRTVDIKESDSSSASFAFVSAFVASGTAAILLVALL